MAHLKIGQKVFYKRKNFTSAESAQNGSVLAVTFSSIPHMHRYGQAMKRENHKTADNDLLF